MMILLTLPATLLTLGLFIFVINGCYLVRRLVHPGVPRRGFWSAFFGAILYSII